MMMTMKMMMYQSLHVDTHAASTYIQHTVLMSNNNVHLLFAIIMITFIVEESDVIL